MTTKHDEVRNILEKGREILQSRPELVEMDFNDILNKLEDETQETAFNRWGVLAWIVVDSIDYRNASELVETLSERDYEYLLAKYVGCILKIWHHTDMAKLILEANHSGKFDLLAPYVIDTWEYESTLHSQYILPILDMLEMHKDHRSYRSFLNNYAEYISRMHAQRVAFDLVKEVSNQTQYLFMGFICSGWFADDSAKANDTLKSLCESTNSWSKRTAISFVQCGLEWDINVFQQYFDQFKKWAFNDADLNLDLISLCVKYIFKTNENFALKSSQIYIDALDYLKEVPSATLPAKQRFIQFICMEKESSNDITEIVRELSNNSFGQDYNMLCAMAQYLYGEISRENWEYAIVIMRNVFVANQYSSKYFSFFEDFNIVRSELAKHRVQVVAKAIRYILQGNIQELFFGVGLLICMENNKNPFELPEVNDLLEPFTSEQMIRIIKAIYYVTYDGEATCYMAFWLLAFQKSSDKTFFTFCANELFAYYPETLYVTAKKYESSANVRKAHLAKIIVEKYAAYQGEQDIGRSIQDLHPSVEHQIIYQKAQLEINNKINEEARKKSLFAQISKTQILKYGKRIAHVAIDKDNKFYQVSPYTKFQYSREFPKPYLEDPVEYELNRRDFLTEVEKSAANH